MRRAEVYFDTTLAGVLVEMDNGKICRYQYEPDYDGPPISLTMPVRQQPYLFDDFPPFFDGLLPEGFQLEALVRQKKLDPDDKFGQLLAIGADTVGAVTIKRAS